MIIQRSIPLVILSVIIAIFLIPNSAWPVPLTDEEADRELRKIGLKIDDPSFPPDLIDAFRAMIRGMFLSAQSTPASPLPGGGTQTSSLLSGPALDQSCSPLPVEFFRDNRGWIYELDISKPADDGSGVPAIMKYVLGLEPENGLPNCLPRPALKTYDGEQYLALTFLRPDWVQGIRYVIESSDDLVNWFEHSDPILLTEPLASGPSHYQRVWLLDEDSGHGQSRMFLRLNLIYY